MSEKERLQLENELLLTCSKAQAINKYIDELEESSKLSELWCKSQQENTKLKERIRQAIAYIEHNKMYNFEYDEEELFEIITDKIVKKDLLFILKGDKE